MNVHIPSIYIKSLRRSSRNSAQELPGHRSLEIAAFHSEAKYGSYCECLTLSAYGGSIPQGLTPNTKKEKANSA